MGTPPNPAAAAGPQPSEIQSAPNLVAFDPRQVVPQQTLYFQRNDRLVFNFITNISGAIVRLNYRWLTPQGEIKEGEYNTPPFNFTFGVNFSLFEGWLLSLGAIQTQGTPATTWTYIQAGIFRAPGAAEGVTAQALFWEGFVYFNTSNGWPGTVTKELTDGPGFIRSITGSTPAAGADILETVPFQRRWSLISFTASLTCSAVVASRIPTLTIDDGVNIWYGVQSIVTSTASSSARYVWSTTSNQNTVPQGNNANPIPVVTPVKASSRIKTSTIALQAGDQWTAPQYLVLEWGNWDA